MARTEILKLNVGDKVRPVSDFSFSGLNANDVAFVTGVSEHGLFNILTADGRTVYSCSMENRYWRKVTGNNNPKEYAALARLDGRVFRGSSSDALRRIGTIVKPSNRGQSIRQIADKLDLSKSAVHRVLQKAGQI